MSIFVDETTPIVLQGATGSEGSFWAKHMIELGSNVVSAVTPGKEGQELHGVPVYHSVRRAQAAREAEAAMLFVPLPPACGVRRAKSLKLRSMEGS